MGKRAHNSGEVWKGGLGMHIKPGNHRITLQNLLSCVVLILSVPVVLHAQMQEIGESELSQINAQSGITYVIGDSGFRITSNSYSFSDTDHDPFNWIEFKNFSIDDGNGNYFSMDTPENDEDFNTVDIGTESSGITSIFMNLSLNVEPRTYTAGNFVFCGQDLGGLQLENYRSVKSNLLVISGRNDGTTGIDLEYQTEIIIDSLRFTYNNQPASLAMSNIHLSQTTSGDPTDPSAWSFSGRFKIGDKSNSNPATMDVGTFILGDGTPVTSAYYNVPMAGSLRIEGVAVGGSNFGPCAIDGINVHHLGIQVPGY